MNLITILIKKNINLYQSKENTHISVCVHEVACFTAPPLNISGNVCRKVFDPKKNDNSNVVLHCVK